LAKGEFLPLPFVKQLDMSSPNVEAGRDFKTPFFLSIYVYMYLEKEIRE